MVRYAPSSAQIAAAMAAADSSVPQARAESPVPSPQSQAPTSVRRWDAAATSRLNQTHWQGASGFPINHDLAQHLKTLRARARYEAANNAIVDGVINTHAIDWVGPDGPRLQVESRNQRFNDQLRALWNEWFANPTICNTISGPALLRQWVRGFWTDGEVLAQIVTDPQAEAAGQPVTMRLQPIDPARLRTPFGIWNPNIALGVERVGDIGRPLRYWIEQRQMWGPYVIDKWDTKPLPADMIVHQFLPTEPDQVRGFPWLAPALQPIADVRDYDTQVLDAARNAADYGVMMWTDHADAPFFLVNEETEVQRRLVRFAPPGYKVEQLRPEQPHTRYIEYRRERLAEIGRSVNMPLMLIRLTAEQHTYSSARMDAQIYQRGLQTYQRWMAYTLDRLLWLIATEAILAGKLPMRPKDARARWTWPRMPHVDPLKEAQAEQTRIKTGSLALQDAAAANGEDIETLVAKRREDAELLEEAGLPPVPTASAGQPDPADAPDEKEPAAGQQGDGESQNEDQSETANEGAGREYAGSY